MIENLTSLKETTEWLASSIKNRTDSKFEACIKVEGCPLAILFSSKILTISEGMEEIAKSGNISRVACLDINPETYLQAKKINNILLKTFSACLIDKPGLCPFDSSLVWSTEQHGGFYLAGKVWEKMGMTSPDHEWTGNYLEANWQLSN